MALELCPPSKRVRAALALLGGLTKDPHTLHGWDSVILLITRSLWLIHSTFKNMSKINQQTSARWMCEDVHCTIIYNSGKLSPDLLQNWLDWGTLIKWLCRHLKFHCRFIFNGMVSDTQCVKWEKQLINRDRYDQIFVKWLSVFVCVCKCLFLWTKNV